MLVEVLSSSSRSRIGVNRKMDLMNLDIIGGTAHVGLVDLSGYGHLRVVVVVIIIIVIIVGATAAGRFDDCTFYQLYRVARGPPYKGGRRGF